MRIKLFEDFLNEAAQRIAWKRPNITRGMMAIGSNQSMRDWQMFVNAEEVLTLTNWDKLSSTLRGNAPGGWRIMVMSPKGNFYLKEAPFDDVEKAKEFAQEWYKMMSDLKDDAPQELKDLRAKMKFPPRPKTREGDFKKILNTLRVNMGDRFKWLISTNRVSPPRTRMVYDPDSFAGTGEFRWVDTRNTPDDALETLRDALGPEWEVSYTKGNGQGTVKITKADAAH